MKKYFWIALIIISTIFVVSCADGKEKEVAGPAEMSAVTLEGMWKLKSGVWDNEDGTFMRYPEDSLLNGPAYIIYSKTHLMTIAKSPNMDYFRGELAEYSILDDDKISFTVRVSNFDAHEGMEATWTFKLEGNLLKTEIGQTKEVWERVE